MRESKFLAVKRKGRKWEAYGEIVLPGGSWLAVAQDIFRELGFDHDFYVDWATIAQQKNFSGYAPGFQSWTFDENARNIFSEIAKYRTQKHIVNMMIELGDERPEIEILRDKLDYDPDRLEKMEHWFTVMG